MKAVIQRVRRASVSVNSQIIAEIGPGLLTLLGVAEGDTTDDADWLIKKIVSLRIFEDSDQKMNLSLKDIAGEHLIVSQFTLYADATKGNRPSFILAARPDIAKPLFDYALKVSSQFGVPTASGQFQASMQVLLENDGPVTLVLDSKKTLTAP